MNRPELPLATSRGRQGTHPLGAGFDAPVAAGGWSGPAAGPLGASGRMVVGLYAHHAGSGHLFRCQAIARELRSLGYATTIFSSRPGADVVVPLDLNEAFPTADAGLLLDAAGSSVDDEGDLGAYPDATAHGSLHWAPLRVPGFRRRMGALAAWITDNDPAAMYVDVSVEVGVLARSLGVPVVSLAMPGSRTDAAHQLGYQQSAALIASWPRWVPVPGHLEPWAGKLRPVGGITRFEGRESPLGTRSVDARAGDSIPRAGGEPVGAGAAGTSISRSGDGSRSRPRVVVLQGSGGDGWPPGYWDDVFAAHPRYEWRLLGGATRVDDPFPDLCAADVVVAAGGQNSVADIAHAGTAAILLPQPRPFDEQVATTAVLEKAELAQVCAATPPVAAWETLLHTAVGTDARTRRARWQRWATDGATARAAEVIAEVARGELL